MSTADNNIILPHENSVIKLHRKVHWKVYSDDNSNNMCLAPLRYGLFSALYPTGLIIQLKIKLSNFKVWSMIFRFVPSDGTVMECGENRCSISYANNRRGPRTVVGTLMFDGSRLSFKILNIRWLYNIIHISSSRVGKSDYLCASVWCAI